MYTFVLGDDPVHGHHRVLVLHQAVQGRVVLVLQVPEAILAMVCVLDVRIRHQMGHCAGKYRDLPSVDKNNDQ